MKTFDGKKLPRDYMRELLQFLHQHIDPAWQIEIRHAVFDGFFVYFTAGKGFGLACARLGIHAKQLEDEKKLAAWLAQAMCVLLLTAANAAMTEACFESVGERQSAEEG